MQSNEAMPVTFGDFFTKKHNAPLDVLLSAFADDRWPTDWDPAILAETQEDVRATVTHLATTLPRQRQLTRVNDFHCYTAVVTDAWLGYMNDSLGLAGVVAGDYLRGWGYNCRYANGTQDDYGNWAIEPRKDQE